MFRYAESVGATHFYTSAKANRGLEEVFNGLAASKSLNSVSEATLDRHLNF